MLLSARMYEERLLTRFTTTGRKCRSEVEPCVHRRRIVPWTVGLYNRMPLQKDPLWMCVFTYFDILACRRHGGWLHAPFIESLFLRDAKCTQTVPLDSAEDAMSVAVHADVHGESWCSIEIASMCTSNSASLYLRAPCTGVSGLRGQHLCPKVLSMIRYDQPYSRAPLRR